MSIVIGIAGSPRKNGNSATLMRALLKGAEAAGAETKEVYLNGLDYSGCQGCDRCSAKGRCIINDDLTPVIEDLRAAGGWVLASPVYYDEVTGQFKTFWDRLRTFTINPGTMENKPQLPGKRRAVLIMTYEDKPRDDYLHITNIHKTYLPWMGSFDKVEVISQGGLGPRDAAAKKPELMEKAEQLGKEMFG